MLMSENYYIRFNDKKLFTLYRYKKKTAVLIKGKQTACSIYNGGIL